jgi:hypothetical protein
VGAIELLTAKQVQVQLALRWSLDGLTVKRSGKDELLRPLLEAEVAKEVAKRAEAGEEEPTKEAEVARLKALGFGKKARAGGPRQPRADGAAPQRARRATEESGSCSDESSDESESDDDDDGIDIDELLQNDEDVYKVEKLLEWRWREGGAREFLVKWEGFSNEETTWEPEENILETGMIKKVIKKRAAPGGAKPPKKAPRPPPAPAPPAPAPPEPTRARSSRAGARAASEAARRAAEREEAASEASDEESESGEAAAPPRAVPTASGKKQKAAAPAGQAKRAKPVAKKPAAKRPKGTAAQRAPDSSDDEAAAEAYARRLDELLADSSEEEEA